MKNLSPVKAKDWDFRTGIKTNAQQVAYATADVHTTIARQLKITRGITLVFHRQKGWWQKRRLALASMCVTGKNPAVVIVPDGAIGSIRVMTKDES